MTIEFHHGDILTTEAQAIGHGVNVDGDMSGGIAVPISKAFPEAALQYQNRCRPYGWLQPGEFDLWLSSDLATPHLVSLASQDRPGPHARIEWLEESLTGALEILDAHEIDSLAIPRIGCGIGGLEWETVKCSIEKIAATTPISIEVWSL